MSLLVLSDCDTVPPGTSEKQPKWQQFTNINSHLLDNKINDLSFDIEGKIWIATDSGANSFNKGLWTYYKDSLSFVVYPPPPTPPTWVQIVNSIASGKTGTLFATKGGGLIQYNRLSTKSIWIRYNDKNGLPFNFINWVATELAHGDIWTATQFGASRYRPNLTLPDEGTWFTYTKDNSPLPTNNIKIVEVNQADNTVWFGTFDRGLVSYDGDTRWEIYPLPPQNDVHITCITFDANSKIWVGRGTATDGGISLLDVPKGTWKHYSFFEGTNGVLPRGRVNAIVTDLGNTRWFGTNNGLVKLQDTTWSIMNQNNTPELLSDTIRALLYDRYKNLWIGTSKGIAVFNPEGVKLK